VTSASTTHPDACLSMLREKHTQQAKTTSQLRRFVGSTTIGMRVHDQSCFGLAERWLHIRDLARTTLLIGAGVSAFTTGDLWVLPSIMVLLCAARPYSGGYSSLS
jgi:hypothetical protein